MHEDTHTPETQAQQGRRLYRLMSVADWRSAVRDGLYRGAPHDVADGFIHLSTAEQVEETAAKHYAEVPDLMVLTVDSRRCDGDIRWEPARGGDLFPHLYGTIPLEAVLAAEPVERDRDGVFVFPSLRDGI